MHTIARLSVSLVICATFAGASGQIVHDGYNGGPVGGPGGEHGWFTGENVEWQAQLMPGEMGDGASRASDCWGYVSASGREYALVGLDTGFAFVEITDPLRPGVVHFESGPTSVWRDIKTYGHHAYGVSEEETGIEVFDLSGIDSGVVTRVGQVTGHGIDATHNVVIDTDSGCLYRVGGGGGDTGLRMYGLTQDPANPAYLGQWTGGVYIHDAQAVTYESGPYAGRQIVFACGGQNGGWTDPSLYIVDVTDKQNVFRVSSLGYAQPGYSHQGWLSPDRRYFYLDDELDEQSYGHPTRTRVFDVEDLGDPEYLGWFSNGNPAMDHNLYTRDDLIFEANYRSGLRVFRAGADPLDSTEIAWLDTFRLDDQAASDGVWSNYPYLPSETLVLCDIQQGLITARLTIDRVDLSLPDGEPAFLTPEGGDSLLVRVAPHGLTPDIASLRLHFDAGEGPVALEPAGMPDPDVYEFVLPGGECGSTASVWVEAPSIEGPVFTLPHRAPMDSLEIAIATESAEPFDEDFESPEGWTVSGDASSGHWEAAVPVNNNFGDPPFDFDTSGRCMLTWNIDEDSDVDGGETVLTSPALDASLGGAISYAVWVGSDSSDPMGDGDGVFVEISDDGGATWLAVASHEEADDSWEEASIDLDGLGVASPTLRVRFIARDAGRESVVEAGIDAVRYRGYGCGCRADVNGDGVLDTRDFLAFLGAWSAREPIADWNGDGVIDTRDFLAYLTEWARGC